MKFPNSFLPAVGMLILAFLVLSQATGAARTISALSHGFVSSVKVLQGRG